jgi:hypothetical protein
MNIGYFAPSYKRPQKSSTQILFPYVKIVVKESEANEYIINGNDVIICPNSAQGNLCRVRNWILDNYLDKYDAIILLDDDYNNVIRWVKQKQIKLNFLEFEELCESITILCKDYNFFYFGLNCVTDKGAYREHTPFSTNKYIGGPFQGFIKGNILRYDENLNLKEDYDMTLQNLKKYKGCLRVNFASYEVKQAEQTGGCAMQRNSKEEERQFNLLQEKWGNKIIQKDKQSKRSFDFNPILKSPLKGV